MQYEVTPDIYFQALKTDKSCFHFSLVLADYLKLYSIVSDKFFIGFWEAPTIYRILADYQVFIYHNFIGQENNLID